jgi:hypothetical protein
MHVLKANPSRETVPLNAFCWETVIVTADLHPVYKERRGEEQFGGLPVFFSGFFCHIQLREKSNLSSWVVENTLKSEGMVDEAL